MSTPFVTFPGTAGNYISTDDVNELDADTAHLSQSGGSWLDANQGVGVWSSANAGYVGDSSILVTSTGAGHGSQTFVHPQTLPVAAEGEIWTATFIADNVSVTGDVIISLTFFDAGGATAGNYDSTISWPAAGTEVSVSGVALAGATKVGLAIHAIVSGVEAYVLRGACLRKGSDSTFVRSVRIVGDLDLRARVAADDWTPAAYNRLISRWSAPPDFAWSFAIRTSSDGKLRLDISSDGTAITSLTSTAATGVTDGATAVVKVTRAAASGDTIFYVDDVKLGDTVASAAFGPYVGGEDLTVGVLSNGTTQPFDGDIYWAEVRDGIDGPVVARMDAGDTAKATL